MKKKKKHKYKNQKYTLHSIRDDSQPDGWMDKLMYRQKIFTNVINRVITISQLVGLV